MLTRTQLDIKNVDPAREGRSRSQLTRCRDVPCRHFPQILKALKSPASSLLFLRAKGSNICKFGSITSSHSSLYITGIVPIVKPVLRQRKSRL